MNSDIMNSNALFLRKKKFANRQQASANVLLFSITEHRN